MKSNLKFWSLVFSVCVGSFLAAGTSRGEQGLNMPPSGFTALFNGKDLTGWKGLAGKGGSPVERAKLTPEQLKVEQEKADDDMRAHWKVEDGVLVFDGKGQSLCAIKDYGDFEMYVDWKILPLGDSGIYLRGTPQVQIWDPAKNNNIGSGGLYNNQKNPSKPLVLADNPVGDWNTFYIKMVGDKVTVKLNDKLVVDNVELENFWERDKPLYPTGQIELQNHGDKLWFRNIYIKELPRTEEKEEGFTSLFDGKSLQGWQGSVDGYAVEDGAIYCKPKGGFLYTAKEYGDFHLKFDFKLTPNANNGIGIRTPMGGDPAYVGMEIQVLDDSGTDYKGLKDYQYHGSIYGVVPCKRGFQKPVGEWNTEEIIAKGKQITVKLNGETIVDADIEKASDPKTVDGNSHPGLKRDKGFICFCGHGSRVDFRNLRIKELK